MPASRTSRFDLPAPSRYDHAFFMPEPAPIHPELDRARTVLRIERDALELTAARLGEEFPVAVDLLRQTMEQNGKIILLGVGKSGHVGDKIAATFSSTGAPAVVLNSLNAVHGDLGLVRAGDTVIALSQSGETEELLHILPALLREGAKIIALTGKPLSSLGRLATVAIDTSVEKEACPLNLAPTASTTVMLALGDALAMALLEQRGFTADQFARYHPGGRLGKRLLLRARDLMRGPERMAVVTPETPISAVLDAITQKRAGAAVVQEASGELAGIFTHGDFIRAYQEDPHIGQITVQHRMTRNPVSIAAESLAVDLLRMLESKRVDDIVVIDATGRPIGLIDSQDLAHHKLW